MNIFTISFFTHLLPITGQCDNERCSDEWLRCSGVENPELYACLRNPASECCVNFLASWDVEECYDRGSNCIEWRDENKLCSTETQSLLSSIMNLCPYACGLCLPNSSTNSPSRPPTLSPTFFPSIYPTRTAVTPRVDLASEAFKPLDSAIVAIIMVILSFTLCCMANGFLQDPCGCGPTCDCFGNYSPPLRPVKAPDVASMPLSQGFKTLDPNEDSGGCPCFSNSAPKPNKKTGTLIKLPQKSSRTEAPQKVNVPLRAQNTSQQIYRAQ